MRASVQTIMMPPASQKNRGEGRVSVGLSGLGDQAAGAEEVPCGGDVVAGFVPKIGKSKEGVVREIDGDEEQRIEHPERDVRARLIVVLYRSGGWRHGLVDGAFCVGYLLLQRDVSESLLVLGEVVADHIPQSLRLLGTEVDALKVLDGDFVRALLGHSAEDQKEVPDAHADLDTVGVAVAIAFGLGELYIGLLGRRVLLAHEFAFWLV